MTSASQQEQSPVPFRRDEGFALSLDQADPLGHLRDRFHLPSARDGQPVIYLCSHSLGLQPKAVAEAMHLELYRWARLGVDGHFHGSPPWYTCVDALRPSMARLVGARTEEVVLMNGLTVNLHLLLASFFRPSGRRRRIVMDWPAFPSDLYAVQSQLRWHGLDPAEAITWVRPAPGDDAISLQAFLDVLDRYGEETALILVNGVNFLTGQFYDLGRLAEAARNVGCPIGVDLAHGVGNVPLALHEWGVDFAVWCTYKYLCGGPGAVAGCFVHQNHADDRDRFRFAGWWGNDPATRFRMHLQSEFVPHGGAAGWQISNPPILALVPLRASLALFDEIGMDALRSRSQRLTAYLEFLIQDRVGSGMRIMTPRDPARRGCQLSLAVTNGARPLFDSLTQAGVIGDFRPPNVIRLAPVPLYNTYHEVWRTAEILRRLLSGAIQR